MAKKEVTIESLQEENVSLRKINEKLKKQLENQKTYTKGLRNKINNLESKAVKETPTRQGRPVYGRSL